MNATWTLGLYPAGWRQQHESRFRNTLESTPVTIADTFDLVAGAAKAHLRPDPAWPEATGAPPAADTAPVRDPRTTSLWAILLAGHISLFIAINAVLAIINLLVDPGNLWFLYALWGWGIVLAAHAGITRPGKNGLLAHAMVSAWISVGLVGVDLATGSPFWSIWPVWALMSLLAIHALHTTGRIGDFGAHVLVSVFGGLELAGLAIIVDDVERIDLAFAMGYWLVGLLVHALYRFAKPTLLQAHAVMFAGTNALLALNAWIEHDSWWFVYPLVAWSVLLAAHAAITFQAKRGGAGEWERTMLAALEQNTDATTGGATARKRIRVRSFLHHAVIFVVGAAMFGVLNLLTMDAGWWAIWPLSVWLVLLCANAGMVAIPAYPNLGLYLAGGGAAAVWLYVLDMNTGPPTWWFWPVGVWALATLIVVPLSIDLLRIVSDQQQQPE